MDSAPEETHFEAILPYYQNRIRFMPWNVKGMASANAPSTPSTLSGLNFGTAPASSSLRDEHATLLKRRRRSFAGSRLLKHKLSKETKDA